MLVIGKCSVQRDCCLHDFGEIDTMGCCSLESPFSSTVRNSSITPSQAEWVMDTSVGEKLGSLLVKVDVGVTLAVVIFFTC